MWNFYEGSIEIRLSENGIARELADGKWENNFGGYSVFLFVE